MATTASAVRTKSDMGGGGGGSGELHGAGRWSRRARRRSSNESMTRPTFFLLRVFLSSTMPTDLASAWDDNDGAAATSVPYGPAPNVSARVAADDGGGSTGAPATQEEVVRALLAELAELRREQQRRDTTLAIVGCLLAAALMSYLDRLHTHIRRLAVPL